MHRTLALFALAALTACAPESGEVTPEPAPEARQSERGIEPGTFERGETIDLRLSVRGAHGGWIAGGIVCAVESCSWIDQGNAGLTLPANTEVELMIGVDQELTMVQLTTPAFSPNEPVEVRAIDGGYLDSLERSFGVVQDADLGVVLLPVEGAALQPELRGADGPFFLDADGNVQPDADGVREEGGTAVWFNVMPGSAEIALWGCAEGGAHWGTPDDELISVAMDAGDVVNLPAVSCD